MVKHERTQLCRCEVEKVDDCTNTCMEGEFVCGVKRAAIDVFMVLESNLVHF